MKVDKFKDSDNWKQYLGKVVEKHSKKPFKCGLHTGVAISYTENHYSGKPAFEMDDGSIVDCYQVKLVNE